MKDKDQTIMSSSIRGWRKINYYYCFFAVELSIIIVFNVYNLCCHGNPLNELMLSSDGQFGDYFMHIGYASSDFGTNIYNYSTSSWCLPCFPPLAYLMYGLLARVAGYVAVDPTDISSHQFEGNNLTIYLLYSIVCIVLLLYSISLYIKRKGFVNQVLFPCVLIFSYPFAFSSLQRGNSVLLVAVLICIALIWRNDESKVKRELALVIIAISAGLKIYPALLGLLYLKEKRYKEAIRLLIYGLLLFFVPFLFFGGIDGLKSFVHMILQLNGEVNRCSISGFANSLMELLVGKSHQMVTTIIQHAFLVFSIIGFFLAKEKWGEVVVLCILMSVYISSGWMYTCIYCLPALLLFLSEKQTTSIRINKRNWIELIVFILFLIVFSIPYKLGYELIYDSMIVFQIFYIAFIIVTFIMRKIDKSKNKVSVSL